MKRQRWKDVAAVFVILFLLPYVVTVLVAGAPLIGGLGHQVSGKQVTLAGPGYEQTISLTEYFIGALAAQIPVNYEPEALKAQAVLVRTYYELHEKSLDVISTDASCQPYLKKEQMEQLWGESYEKNYKKLEMAVTDSQDDCLFYQKKLAEPYYHALSAGKTRSGEEVFRNPDYAYLASVDCSPDITADHYVTMRSFTMSDVTDMLQQSCESAQTLDINALKEMFQKAQKDTAGYILTMECNGSKIHAETLRSQLGLPSACFDMEEWDDGIRFVCRGLGHGIGMSLYTANELAKQGQGYKEILNYFFHDITISPIENE